MLGLGQRAGLHGRLAPCFRAPPAEAAGDRNSATCGEKKFPEGLLLNESAGRAPFLQPWRPAD